MGITSFSFLKQSRNMDGDWSSWEPESNGFIQPHPLSVSHDGVAGEIPSVSTPEMMGHLDMIFTSLSQKKVFFSIKNLLLLLALKYVPLK